MKTKKETKYRIACICGSTKFKETMEQVRKTLTREGYIVLGPEIFGHAGDDLTSEEKEMLDDMHKQKILLSDVVVIVDRANKEDRSYLGESTLSEIIFAQEHKKTVMNAYEYFLK